MPWTVLRWSKARTFQHPYDPAPLPRVRPEELQHPSVVGAGLSRERPGNDVRQVIVTDDDRIRIAVNRLDDTSRSPRADARDRLQAFLCQPRFHLCSFLKTSRSRARASQDVRPGALDAEGMELVIRDRRKRLWVRGETEPEGARSRGSEPICQEAERAMCFPTGDPLAEHGGDQGIHDHAGAAHPPPGVATLDVSHHIVAGYEFLRPVVEPHERRKIVQCPRGSGTPCGTRDLPARQPDIEDGRSLGGPTRELCGARRETDGRVRRAVTERGKGGTQVEGHGAE